LIEAHDSFKASLSAAQSDFNQLAALDKQIKSFKVGVNPYTWFTMEALNGLQIKKHQGMNFSKET
jgi:spectrin alpha